MAPPPTTSMIISHEEYHAFDDLPSPIEDEDQETQITAAIKLATSYIEEKTGREYYVANDPSPNDVIEILDGNGSSRLYTRNAPIIVVSKIEYWTGTQWDEYDSTSYPYTYKVDSNIVYFTQGHKFFKGYQNIRVTFEFGYDTELPHDLKLACYLITKHIIMESVRLGITSQTTGEQTFSYEHSMDSQAMEIIARYKTVW